MTIINERLFIITPSYIGTKSRFLLANKSFQSLAEALDNQYTHVVVDDLPFYQRIIPPKISSRIPRLKWLNSARKIYNSNNVVLHQRFGSGSASAVLSAVRTAKNQGADLVFVHLDDHVYIPILKNLIKHAIDAFNNDNKLLMVRFSGYPLIYNHFNKLTYEKDNILFDKVILNPHRTQNYTLWWSYFNEVSVAGRYWPIALWFCIYRVDILENILSSPPVLPLKHLAHVEEYYKNIENWHNYIENINGKFGFINMQYGGIEMHRNKNWKELLTIPNEPIR